MHLMYLGSFEFKVTNSLHISITLYYFIKRLAQRELLNQTTTANGQWTVDSLLLANCSDHF
jgi:hypothetical protein